MSTAKQRHRRRRRRNAFKLKYEKRYRECCEALRRRGIEPTGDRPFDFFHRATVELGFAMAAILNEQIFSESLFPKVVETNDEQLRPTSASRYRCTPRTRSR